MEGSHCDLPLTEVSKEHARLRQAARLAKGIAPATINREIDFLKARLQQAVDDEILARNPLARFKKLPEDNMSDRFLLEPEEDRLEAVMAPADFDLVAIAIDTGLRQSEQFKLAWTSVNFENGGWLSIRGAKDEKSRSVPLTARALAILQRLYASRTSAFVFPNSKGRPRSSINFYQRQFQPALAAAGVEGVVWHTLRHTTASRLALQGKSPQAIAQILGHSQTKTTERYAHLLPESARATISALERPHKGGLRAVRLEPVLGREVRQIREVLVVGDQHESGVLGTGRDPDVVLRDRRSLLLQGQLEGRVDLGHLVIELDTVACTDEGAEPIEVGGRSARLLRAKEELARHRHGKSDSAGGSDLGDHPGVSVQKGDCDVGIEAELTSHLRQWTRILRQRPP